MTNLREQIEEGILLDEFLGRISSSIDSVCANRKCRFNLMHKGKFLVSPDLVAAECVLSVRSIDADGKCALAEYDEESRVEMEREVYEGLLITVLAASQKKVAAGISEVAKGEYQTAYPPGVIEVGIALDAIDMIVTDVMNFIKANAGDEWETE